MNYSSIHLPPSLKKSGTFLVSLIPDSHPLTCHCSPHQRGLLFWILCFTFPYFPFIVMLHIFVTLNYRGLLGLCLNLYINCIMLCTFLQFPLFLSIMRHSFTDMCSYGSLNLMALYCLLHEHTTVCLCSPRLWCMGCSEL